MWCVKELALVFEIFVAIRGSDLIANGVQESNLESCMYVGFDTVWDGSIHPSFTGGSYN